MLNSVYPIQLTENIMKRIIIALFASTLLLFGNSAFAAEKVVVYGDDSYPPYTYLDAATKKPMGIYVEILQAAFAKMPDYEVTIELVPWKNALNKVETGTGLAMFPPYYNVERDAWMSYSEPLLAELIVVYGTEEKLKGKTKWPDDFYGSKIGLNSGFSPLSMGGKTLVDAIAAGKITLDDEGKSNEICLKKVAAGRLDFYLNDRLIDISATPTVKRSEIVVSENNGFLGFTKKTEKFPYITDFKTKFDAIVKELKQSGAIEAIVSKKK